MAGGLGLEPRLTESESVVLPLDDPPMVSDSGVLYKDCYQIAIVLLGYAVMLA